MNEKIKKLERENIENWHGWELKAYIYSGKLLMTTYLLLCAMSFIVNPLRDVYLRLNPKLTQGYNTCTTSRLKTTLLALQVG